MACGCVAPFFPLVFEQCGARNIQTMQFLINTKAMGLMRDFGEV